MKKNLVVSLSFLALASVYLLYWPDAEYVVDDWFHLDRYYQGVGKSLGERLRILGLIFNNTIYGDVPIYVKQLYFVTNWINCLLVWAFGYAPKVAFGVLLSVHWLNACLFEGLLRRLGAGRAAAFLAGATLLVIPTAHGPLFWPVNCAFFVWPTLWLLLYLRHAWGILERGRIGLKEGGIQAVLVLVTLFSGSPAAFLLLLAPAWMAWCFAGREKLRTAAAVTALNWALVATAIGFYPPFSNKSKQADLPRYYFTRQQLAGNTEWLALRLERLSGLTESSYYKLGDSTAAPLIGLTAGALVFLVARRLGPSSGTRSPARVALFAAGMAVLAYLPLAVLWGATLRHYYTFSPYLSLLLMTPLAALGGTRRRVWGPAAAALLGAYFTACTVAEIEQCWRPQSRHLQALKDGLRRLTNLSPGDLVLVPRAELILGTAPHFALLGGPWDHLFAKSVTGVPDLKFWREIVVENGRLSLFHRGFMKPTDVSELERAHVLEGGPAGPFRPMRYWAEAAGPDSYRLRCLKDTPCKAPAGLARDAGESVYVPKPFDHSQPHRYQY